MCEHLEWGKLANVGSSIPRNVVPHEIIECLGLKLISHFTIIMKKIYSKASMPF